MVTTVGMIGEVDSSMADSDAVQDTVGTNNPSLGLVQFPAFSMRATSSAAKLTVLTTLKLATLGVNVGVVLGTTPAREGTAHAQLHCRDQE